MSNERKHLYYLNELDDYKVKSEDPDVTGWKVKDAENRVIGRVNNLLVNKERKQVVYLDVEVDKSIIEANHDPYGKPSNEIHEFINKDGENHLIVPIGLANLNEDEQYVYTDRIDHRTFAETKRMEKGSNIDRDYEVIVLESYNRDQESRMEDERRRSEEERRRESEREFETRPDDSYKQDYGRNKSGKYEDDDSFYDRKEFDRSNSRRENRR